MIVVVQGTNDFNDYNVFIRAMGVALSGMKARGMKIKNFKVPASWVSENMEYVNYFAFLSKPKQQVSKLVAEAELKNIEVGIFRY